MKIFYAECDQFDNSRTGYHATEAEAEAAFWAENHFSRDERRRARVYVSSVDSDDPEVIEAAKYLASQGSPSPALGIVAQ